MNANAYKNPLVNADFPDPSVIAVKEGGYFAYATHDEFSPSLTNILLRHSWDLIHWSEPKGALKYPPVWAQRCERFWCPQVVYVNGQYRLYYAAEPDTKDGMCLAVALSDSPEEFIDSGYPLTGSNGTAYAMIDPCFFEDPKSGKHYLYYGSAHEPIRAVELAPDGKSFLDEPVAVLWPVADAQFEQLREGAFITYNKTYDRYFLWVSGDNTWAENGYAVSVFWSDHPVSGFQKIPDDHLVLRPNTYWDAPGQNCVLTDAQGAEWLIYHAVDTQDRYIPGTDRFLRKMCMDRILYTADGWPYIKGGSPSQDDQPGPSL